MRRLILFILLGCVAGEDGLAGWLRYAPLECDSCSPPALPTNIVALNTTESSPVYVAGQELQKGLHGIFGKHLNISHELSEHSSSLIVGTLDGFNTAGGQSNSIPELAADGYLLKIKGGSVQILGQNERGALYGAFEYLSRLAQANFSDTATVSNPHAPIRWVNQWDNMDGSIERGYGGPSIFFHNGSIVEDLTRASQYARLCASIGINTIVVNNVNANYTTLKPEGIEGLGRIADVFRPWGVQLGLSLYFASPANLTDLGTFDPLNETVIDWWQDITTKIYHRIPDMAGYLVKANSEGQPGPLTYNRTLAEGANLFARAVEPYGGVVMFRAFVYNQFGDWTDWYADRANAAVEFFKHLDGQFHNNVIVQIKYGPIDFQVREPPSPLFANIPQTNVAIELQVTQEYLGQQDHLVYLPPLWKIILDFDLRVDSQPSTVSDIISGQRFNRSLGGSAGVVNVGTNTTWLGSHLAMSNFYAYGRLEWDSSLIPEAILADWIQLTFGHDQLVIDTITEMSMLSWPAYENYTGNLGIQTLTDILYTHFGPNPASQDNNGWGHWTRADHNTIGMDRTVANGTKNTAQYPPEVGNVFENISTCPDDLLLWFHHVNYTHSLHSGSTVIQHFYDAHCAGANIAATFPAMWTKLAGKVDEERFEHMLHLLNFQAGHSIVWRDAINNFYYNLSGIDDEKGRVGHHPWRIQAENMQLDGYESYEVNPFETASNATAIVTTSNTTTGSASAVIDFPSGTYDIGVNYYDLISGYDSKAHYKLSLNDHEIGNWDGNAEDVLGHAPSRFIDGHSASRKRFDGIRVERGDRVRVVGRGRGMEPAPLDYIVLLPEGIVD